MNSLLASHEVLIGIVLVVTSEMGKLYVGNSLSQSQRMFFTYAFRVLNIIAKIMHEGSTHWKDWIDNNKARAMICNFFSEETIFRFSIPYDHPSKAHNHIVHILVLIILLMELLYNIL